MKKIYLKPQSRIFSVDAEKLMAGSIGDGTTVDLGGYIDPDDDNNDNQFARDNDYWDYEW